MDYVSRTVDKMRRCVLCRKTFANLGKSEGLGWCRKTICCGRQAEDKHTCMMHEQMQFEHSTEHSLPVPDPDEYLYASNEASRATGLMMQVFSQS